jgi:hypothetical protein
MVMNPPFRVSTTNNSRINPNTLTLSLTNENENDYIHRAMTSIVSKIGVLGDELSGRQSKLLYYYNHHEKSIFISLIISTIFNLFVNRDETTINFQGSNAKVRYYAVNIFSISTIYKNIPYYTYPNENYWTIINIKPNNNWMNNITFFSITPYIGQYEISESDQVEYVDYLANVNTAFNSILCKSNNETIFNDENQEISVIYTFSSVLQKVSHNPKKNTYAFLLPNIFRKANFSFIARFQRKDESIPLHLEQYFSALTFSKLPFTDTNLLEINQMSDVYLYNELVNYNRKNTDYNINKENIDAFIATSKSYNESDMNQIKIYPYFYLKNNNTVVTNAYQLINTKSTCNALINDYNKNYYNTEIITLRDADGNLQYNSLKILAINHSKSGYATESNIQIYNVNNQKSIYTLLTSSSLPTLSDSTYPSSKYNGSQTLDIIEEDIDLTTDTFSNIEQIAVFERVSYPISTYDHQTKCYVNSGPRYTSFYIDPSSEQENSSTNDTVDDVESESNIYLIKTNDSDFSLAKNYSPYSTLNFRVYLS